MVRLPAVFLLLLVLTDPTGDQYTEARHAIEDVATDFGLDLLIGQCSGVNAPSEVL